MTQLRHKSLGSVFAAVFALLIGLFASSASAHLMPAGKGTLNVVGSKVYLVASLPVAALYVGSDHKHHLDSRELMQDEEVLRDRVRRGIELRSHEGTAVLEQILLSLPSGEGHEGAKEEEILVMIVARFASPPTSIALASELWTTGAGELRIKATKSAGSKTLNSEAGTLSRAQPSFLFFAQQNHLRWTQLFDTTVRASIRLGCMPVLALGRALAYERTL